MPARAESRRHAVLPRLTAAAAGAALSPPRLPAAAAASVAMARRAAALAVPVRLDVPVAGPRSILARALHAQGDRPGPLVVAGRPDALEGLPAGASVLIDGEALTPTRARVVEALIDDGAVWVLVAAAHDTRLPGVLAARLASVTIVVPPLHERADDVAELARDLLATMSARGACPAPVLTQAAIDWLGSRPWPGDVAELEATLAGALLRTDGPSVDASHLAATQPANPVPHGRGAAQLEFLLAQLAHELRNPLAVVQTFSRLPGLAEDADLRERFAAVTHDAVSRMDALIDNATTFARLGAPKPVDVELGPLLDPLVGEIRPALAERAVALGYASPNGARCRADRDQLAFALRNVLAGVAHEVPPHDAVRIDATAPGTVRVEFDDRHGTTERLRHLVLAEADDPAVLALPFTLARAVLERGGGALTMQRQPDGRAVLELRLPGASADGG
jgi:signal transduction histidine kinase